MKDRLKELRKSLKLTQEEFAKRIGIKRNTVATYEIGRNEPIDGIIYSICREFNVNEEWLRTGCGEMFIEMDKENQLMSWAGDILKNESDSFKRRFIKMLMGLDEKDWATLEKMAKKLHEKG